MKCSSKTKRRNSSTHHTNTSSNSRPIARYPNAPYIRRPSYNNNLRNNENFTTASYQHYGCMFINIYDSIFLYDAGLGEGGRAGAGLGRPRRAGAAGASSTAFFEPAGRVARFAPRDYEPRQC